VPPVAEDAGGPPSMLAPLPELAYPTAELARSGLWDEAARAKLAKPKFKKRDIDARKAEVRLVKDLLARN
jgi:hypothetical protein